MRVVVSWMIGILLGAGITAIAGENPVHVIGIILNASFGSVDGFVVTLFYAVPLVFTGLSVAFAFRTGLFNIGAEGQLTMGALAAVLLGVLVPGLPGTIGMFAGIIAAVIAGGVWGMIAGWLRAYRGGHEVISTIMLNFLASAISSYVVLYQIKNPNSQNPESSSIPDEYRFPDLGFNSGFALVLALLLAVGIFFFFRRTRAGFELEVVGQSEKVAERSGIDPKRTQLFALAIAGGLAGLVGASEILGHAGKFKIGFSPGFGFTGIAVALLARSNPLGVLLTALLMASLHKGSMDLDFETEKVTRDLSFVLQAFVILAVSSRKVFWKKKEKSHA